MNPLLQGNVLLGLLAAFFWGGGDFSGGMGVKYAGGTLGAAAISQMATPAIRKPSRWPAPGEPSLKPETTAGIAAASRPLTAAEAPIEPRARAI